MGRALTAIFGFVKRELRSRYFVRFTQRQRRMSLTSYVTIDIGGYGFRARRWRVAPE